MRVASPDMVGGGVNILHKTDWDEVTAHHDLTIDREQHIGSIREQLISGKCLLVVSGGTMAKFQLAPESAATGIQMLGE